MEEDLSKYLVSIHDPWFTFSDRAIVVASTSKEGAQKAAKRLLLEKEYITSVREIGSHND